MDTSAVRGAAGAGDARARAEASAGDAGGVAGCGDVGPGAVDAHGVDDGVTGGTGYVAELDGALCQIGRDGDVGPASFVLLVFEEDLIAHAPGDDDAAAGDRRGPEGVAVGDCADQTIHAGCAVGSAIAVDVQALAISQNGRAILDVVEDGRGIGEGQLELGPLDRFGAEGPVEVVVVREDGLAVAQLRLTVTRGREPALATTDLPEPGHHRVSPLLQAADRAVTRGEVSDLRAAIGPRKNAQRIRNGAAGGQAEQAVAAVDDRHDAVRSVSRDLGDRRHLRLRRKVDRADDEVVVERARQGDPAGALHPGAGVQEGRQVGRGGVGGAAEVEADVVFDACDK